MPVGYKVYGLTLASSILFPELVPAPSSKADVTIDVSRQNSVLPKKGARFHFPSQREADLQYCGIGRFRVLNGNKILVDPVLNVTDPILRFFLLGPVLGTLLYQRGYFVLHASAVLAKRGALLFAGEKEAGKSTLAAYFYKNGYPVVTDDIAAIRLNGPKPEVVAGPPHMKLISKIPPPNVLGITKKTHATKPLKSQRPVPIAAVFILEDAKKVALELLSASDALGEMIRHSYRVEWFHELDKERHFKECARLADSVKVFRLSRPRGLKLLPGLRRRVLDSVK